MSMKPRPSNEMPEETRQLGQHLLKPTNVMRLIGERLPDFLHDEDFADLYPPEGRPAVWPALLALVTVFQWAEALSDRQAADAVVTHLDWKYALHLPLAYRGFDFSVLSEFRQRLLTHQAEHRVFETLLDHLKTLGLVRARGLQRTDSLAVISAVSRLSRLELVYETVRVTLMALKRTEPAWFERMIPPRFVDEYGERGEQERWVKETGEKAHAEIQRRAQQIGQDGQWVLDRLDAPDTPPSLPDLPEVATLRTVWAQQFQITRPPDPPTGSGGLAAQFRPQVASGGADTICTPHDPEARYSEKRGHSWQGYKVHLTETVAEDRPRIITDVHTTTAPASDFEQVAPIQIALLARDLAPAQQAVDMGYVSGKNIAESAERTIELIGPARPDGSRQAHLPGGVTLSQFTVDSAQRVAQCPAGQASVTWYEYERHGQREIQIRFAGATCGACPRYTGCVMRHGAKPQGRTLQLRPYYEFLVQQRDKQRTERFKALYRRRAGIEATLSLGVRTQGLRISRYLGLKKTALQHAFIATACNLKRAARWWAGERPVERGRRPKSMMLPTTPPSPASSLPAPT
jgi:transposase